MGSPPPEKSQYELLRDKRVAEVENEFGPVLAARKELSVLTSPSLLLLHNAHAPSISSIALPL